MRARLNGMTAGDYQAAYARFITEEVQPNGDIVFTVTGTRGGKPVRLKLMVSAKDANSEWHKSFARDSIIRKLISEGWDK